MTFMNEVATSVARAKTKVEEIQVFVATLTQAAEDAQREMALADAGADKVGEGAENIGIEDDIYRATVLSQHVRQVQEYTNALLGDISDWAEIAEGTRQQIEELQTLIAQMGGTTQ